MQSGRSVLELLDNGKRFLFLRGQARLPLHKPGESNVPNARIHGARTTALAWTRPQGWRVYSGPSRVSHLERELPKHSVVRIVFREHY
jgi:hypothetical protein